MKVYVVLCGDCEGAQIDSVWTTKEAAEKVSSDVFEVEVDEKALKK